MFKRRNYKKQENNREHRFVFIITATVFEKRSQRCL